MHNLLLNTYLLTTKYVCACITHFNRICIHSCIYLNRNNVLLLYQEIRIACMHLEWWRCSVAENLDKPGTKTGTETHCCSFYQVSSWLLSLGRMNQCIDLDAQLYTFFTPAHYYINSVHTSDVEGLKTMSLFTY